MPQSRLNRFEIRFLPQGNQFTKHNVIRWQCVKGAAVQAGVTDWLSKVDTKLTYQENMTLMRKYGTKDSSRTMRQLAEIQ
jgi:hypothetical protein